MDSTPVPVSQMNLIDEAMRMMTKEQLSFIQLLFLDHRGTLHSLEERAEALRQYVVTGVGVDGSSIPGFASVERSDIKLVPEIETFACFTLGDEKIACVMCHFETPEGKRHPHDPRNALWKVIEKARSMGFEPHVHGELEFILVNAADGSPADEGGYLCLPPEDKSMGYRHELARILEEANISVKRIHHECAPGQNEVELCFAPALKAADDQSLAIWLARLLATKYGWRAEFAPKVNPDAAGNGLHQHTILANIKTGDNAFSGTEKEWLSVAALQFIAGQLKYADEIIAIQARDASCFVRMQPGHEAPNVVSWGFMNRSAMVRIPLITPGNESKTRVEFRAGDASGPPHFLIAGCLLGGLKGIAEKLEPAEESTCNLDTLDDAQLAAKGLHRLPMSFQASHKILAESPFVKEIMEESGSHLLLRSCESHQAQMPVKLGNWDTMAM